MEKFSLWEIGFVSSRISTLLVRIRRGETLKRKDLFCLKKGRDFLSQMMSTSLLIEDMVYPDPLGEERVSNYKVSIFCPVGGFGILKKGQESLRNMNVCPSGAMYSVIFDGYRSDLEKLFWKETIEDSRVFSLLHFFRNLHEIVWSDIVASRYRGDRCGLGFHRIAA